MAVLSRDDFFARLQTQIGTDTSEESINFLEDMTDTYNNLEQNANGDGVDWHARYDELDKSWRAKYQHRFFNGGNSYSPAMGNNFDDDDDKKNPENITVRDLFT